MSRQRKWSIWAAAACLLIAAGMFTLALVATGAAPAEPIVLQFRDSAVFLGPHEHSVTSIVFSPDDNVLATGCADGYVRFWRATDGTLVGLRGDDATRGITSLAFSPSGERIAAVGGFLDNEVVLWNASSSDLARAFAPRDRGFGTVRSKKNPAPFRYQSNLIDFRLGAAVAYSPDGRLLASAAGEVVLRDAVGGQLTRTLAEGMGMSALAFAPMGEFLVTAGQDGKVRRWRVADGSLQATYEGPTQPLRSLALAPNGNRWGASSDGPASLFQSSKSANFWHWTASDSRAWRIELGSVSAGPVAFVDSANVVVAAGHELLAFNLDDRDNARRLIWAQADDISAVAFSSDRTLLACGGKDRSVDVIEWKTGRLRYHLPGANDRPSSVSVSTDGTRFAVATHCRPSGNRLPSRDSASNSSRSIDAGDGGSDRRPKTEVRIGSLRDGRLHPPLPLPLGQWTSVVFIPSRDELVVGGATVENQGSLTRWRSADGVSLGALPTRRSPIVAIAAAPNGQLLASADAVGVLDWWDLATNTSLRSLQRTDPIGAISFSPDGKLLACALRDRTVELLRADGTLERSFRSRLPLDQVAFSPDGSLLAGSSGNAGVEIWKTQGASPSRSFNAPGDFADTMPGFVAFSPDGKWIAARGHGKDIAVFEAETGALKTELRGHDHPATAAAYLPDGRLLSGGDDRTVRLWDPLRNRLAVTWMSERQNQSQGWDDEWVGFTPEGRFVGSKKLRRLVGWQRNGAIIVGASDPAQRPQVDSLKLDQPMTPPTP